MRQHGNDRHLLCVSLDGLAAEDRAQAEALPHLGRLLRDGASAGRVRAIYPTQTYPLHATVVTGVLPVIHGIPANTRFQPGRERPDWFWHRRDVRAPTLYDLAREAGLRAALFLWPTAGGARVPYLLPEIEAAPWKVLRNGSPAFLLEALLCCGGRLRGTARGPLDDFTTAAAAHLIRTRRPHLVMLHLLDFDHNRHLHGASSARAGAVLREEDARLGLLLGALEQAGIRERTTVAVLGDHGLVDVDRQVRLNAIFRREGLLEKRAPGRASPWLAWANTCEGSAQVRLRDRGDGALRRRVGGLLASLARDGGSGVQAVIGREEALAQGVGDLDFVVEARRGYAFSADAAGEPLEAGGRHRAAHGYHPDSGYYNSFFLLEGRGVRPGGEPTAPRIADVGPTMAALLGLRLPAPADSAAGRPLTEMLA